MASKKNPKGNKSSAKWFQNECLIQLRNLYGGPVQYATELSDGMVRVPSKAFFVHAYPAPADHMGYTPDGRCILVEAKNVEREASLRVLKRGEKGSGLKFHQFARLLEVAMSGGVGLLLVRFARFGVYALDGVYLGWWCQGEDRNATSISAYFFKEFGECLGDADDFTLPESLFKPRRPLHRPVTFPGGKVDYLVPTLEATAAPAWRQAEVQAGGRGGGVCQNAGRAGDGEGASREDAEQHPAAGLR